MKIEKSIDIIKSLPLLDKSDSNIEALAKELEGHVLNLKVMHPLKMGFYTTEDKEAFKKLRNAITKSKKLINDLSAAQKEMLCIEINELYEIEGNEKYLNLTKIQNLLTPIEKTCDSFIDKKNIPLKDRKFKALDLIYDNIGALFLKATGNMIARDNDTEFRKAKHTSEIFISAVCNHADINKFNAEYIVRGIADRAR